MKQYAKQLRLAAIVLLAVLMMVGMAFVTFAEETNADENAAIDLSGVTWVLEGTETAPDGLVYTGEKYTVVPTNLPEGVKITKKSGNTAANAGNYTAKITLSYTDANGKAASTVIEREWSVAKAVYDMSGISFTDGTLTYNGEAQNLAVTGELPQGLKVSYGSGYTEVGVYEITATFTGNKNYEDVEPMTATLTIEKAVYDMSAVSFSDTTLIYRGIPQSIAIAGTLPRGVRVSYDGSYTEAGTYTVVASFKGDAHNYELIPDMSATLTIVPATPDDCVYTYKDSAGNTVVKVVAADGIPADKLNVVDNSYLYGTIDVTTYFAVDVLASYDLTFTFNGAVQSVDDMLTVTLLIPESLRDNDKLEIAHIDSDGRVESVAAERIGDTFVFETDHFSTFAIVVSYSTLKAPEQQIPWYLYLLGVLLVLVIIFLIVALCLKSRDDGNNDGEPTEETPVEEAPAEEAPAEETPAEEAPAEEAPVEEAPAEEAPAEEAPAEEAPAEETPAEETPAEEAPVAPVGDDDDEGDSGSAVIDGQVVMVRYRSSFMSRLIQADTDTQDYYTVIKNTLLSYKGVKARTSWNYESFNKGRFQCAKLNVKGRTLTLYLALAPDEYSASKYHFSDVSGKGKFDKVPMMLKVRSDRALKYAIELIDELMKAHDIEAGPAQNVDYHMPYESNEALAERDLVKIILPDGVTLGENDSIQGVDVSDVIDSFSDKK